MNNQLKLIGANRTNESVIQGRNSIDSEKEMTELQKDFFLLEGKLKTIESSFDQRLKHFDQ